MVEIPIVAGVVAVTKAVFAAVSPATAAEGLVGNRADALVVRGVRGAGYLLGCLQSNWKRLEPQENHVLYRAMLVAHWRALQQTVRRFAGHRGIDLKCLTKPVVVPRALSEIWLSKPPLGVLSSGEIPALQSFIEVCDERVKDLEAGSPIVVPADWEKLLDGVYNDLGRLMGQDNVPQTGPSDQAWIAFAKDFPGVAAIDGLKDYFALTWYGFFSVNFQILAVAHPALLTGKLFSELRQGAGEAPLDAQAIFTQLETAIALLRGLDQKMDWVVAKIQDALAQARLAPVKEPLIGIENTAKRILARDVQADALLAALRTEGPGIVTVCAPPGFGKSALFGLALKRALPSGHPAEAGLEGIAVVNAGNTVPGMAAFAQLLGRISGLQEAAAGFADAAPEDPRALELFIDLLRRVGPVWLVVENAENALPPDVGWRALLTAWCQKDHRAKLLLLSRTALLPAPPCHRRLPDVEAALLGGLPEAAAVELLLASLEGTRFIATPQPLLREIVSRLQRVPMALEQFAGYLRANEEGITLDRHFVDTSDLLHLFHPGQMEPYLLRLIGEHLKSIGEPRRALLAVVEWAGQPVPQSGLLALSDSSLLTGLVRSGLLLRVEGTEAEGVSYSLHPLIAEGVRELAVSPGPSERVAQVFLESGTAEWRKAQFRPALDSYRLSERAYRELVGRGRGELKNNLAGALVNRGNALNSLGRLGEAVEAHDDAIGMLRPLVGQGRGELANDLAAALMNRGNALDRLAHSGEAVEACDEAIGMLRKLVGQGRGELENDLARALMNRGNALNSLGRLGEAVEAYDEAIGMLRKLVGQGRGELENDLASALMNRGNALSSLGRFGEAVEAYDEAIGMRRKLVGQGRGELENDLASALMNRGVALRSLGRLGEAVEAYDEAIGMLRKLVDQGRGELENGLATALYNLAGTRFQQGETALARAAAREARQLWAKMVDAGMQHLSGSLKDAIDLENQLSTRIAAFAGFLRRMRRRW